MILFLADYSDGADLIPYKHLRDLNNLQEILLC